MPGSDGPLANVRVLDLTRVLAGPTATQILGDLGADVIKVERPGVGDDTRGWGPPYLTDAAGRETGESAYFLSANRNKRSVTIDLGQAEGCALVRRLARRSDVLIENFKVGDMARFGLGWQHLHGEMPGLVYCSISGFGQTGPYAAQAGYDFLIQGLGGIMSITGAADGPPTKVGVAVADIVCGLYAATAVLAALRHRDATGRGQYIDLALLDTQVAWLANQAMNYLIGGSAPGRLGNAHPNIVPYQSFPTADGSIIVAVGNDTQFARFAAVLQAGEWASDPRFARNADRVRNRAILVPLIEARLAVRPSRHWLAALAQENVPAGPVNDIAQVFADPQVRHRGMAVSMPHPAAGPAGVPLVADPINLSDTPVSYRRPPPRLGEHTEEVLQEVLDLNATECADLRHRGIV
jgi:crotonobetainyl-CoA:carnitine CoA-transferase CaiB-like acyl-CoA transferase